ncbi:MAG: sarcosine oxidase subunit gamma family protein [Alphaproteobacteria bacterium]|nr:sarcosine oxidase subunit gamma family protein [Alphaproteobacteria bacterium]
MPDPQTRQSALAHPPQPGELIQERRDLWIQRLYAPHGVPILELPAEPNQASCRDGLHALWLAPGEYLLVCEAGAAPAAIGDVPLSDLSHARTVFRIPAAAAREILAKDCPLDLRGEVFSPGHCAQSLLAGVAILVHLLEDGAHMDIYVARSYGQFMHAWLKDAALSP